MRKKYIILAIGLLVFLTLVYFLNDSSTRDSVKQKPDDENELESTKVVEDQEEVNLIDYYNLEAENRKLKAEIDDLKSELFEHTKAFMNPNSNSIHQYYEQLKESSVYNEVRDDRIIVLVENENSFRLTIGTKETSEYIDIHTLNQDEMINYTTGTDGIVSGLVNSKEIKTIIVHVNDTSYEAEIINFADGISFWYTLYEHKRKSTSEEPDKIRMEALDKDGELIWEGRFQGNLGG